MMCDGWFIIVELNCVSNNKCSIRSLSFSIIVVLEWVKMMNDEERFFFFQNNKSLCGHQGHLYWDWIFSAQQWVVFRSLLANKLKNSLIYSGKHDLGSNNHHHHGLKCYILLVFIQTNFKLYYRIGFKKLKHKQKYKNKIYWNNKEINECSFGCNIMVQCTEWDRICFRCIFFIAMKTDKKYKK